jgi:hypothetical protein
MDDFPTANHEMPDRDPEDYELRMDAYSSLEARLFYIACARCGLMSVSGRWKLQGPLAMWVASWLHVFLVDQQGESRLNLACLN